MAEQSYYFQKLTRNDYALFLKYYTQIRYSYFKNDDPNPNKKEITDFLTRYTESVSPRHISKANYWTFLTQANIYLYHDSLADVNQAVGLLMFSNMFTGKKVIIHEFYVLDNLQGKGLGKKMYEDFLEILRKEGNFKVMIELMCSFVGAEEFWKKMGFRLCRKEKVIGGLPGSEKRYYSKTEKLGG